VHRLGDYHRYMAEFSSGEARSAAATASHEGYQAASAIAEQVRCWVHPAGRKHALTD
jgi:14-3-3 protein epsilon